MVLYALFARYTIFVMNRRQTLACLFILKYWFIKNIKNPIELIHFDNVSSSTSFLIIDVMAHFWTEYIIILKLWFLQCRSMRYDCPEMSWLYADHPKDMSWLVIVQTRQNNRIVMIFQSWHLSKTVYFCGELNLMLIVVNQDNIRKRFSLFISTRQT